MSIRDDLKAFVDNELPPERAEEVRLAIEQDPALQQEVHFMKLLSREIQESAAEPEIKGAAEVIEVVRKKPGVFSRYRTAWAVGGIAFVLLLALPYLNPQSRVATGDMASTPMARNLIEFPSGMSSATPAAAAAAKAADEPSFKRGLRSVGSGAPEASFGRESRESMSEGVNAPTTVTSPSDESGDAQAQAPAPESKAQALIQTPRGNRKIIQNGDLGVTVEDVQSAQNKATNLAAANGGFVENSSLDYDSQSQPTAKLTLRIPSPRFAAVAAAIQGYGKVTSNHMTGEDVTAQYADVNARLQELGAEEDSYVTMLRGAKSIGQILEIKDRLSQVRQEIQSDHAQAEALKDQSALSTLNLTFEQKPRAGKPNVPQKDETQDTWAKDTWANALNGLTAAGRFLGQALIFLFVYSPIWIPIAVLVWWLNKRKK